MRFAVFTHVKHHEREGKYFGYAPYVREMNIWFQIFNSEFGIQNSELGGEVEVVGPMLEEQEEFTGLAYEHSQLSFTKIPSFDLLSWRGVPTALFKIPFISFRIIGAMRRAAHLHLRCPGNIGLLACILQIFFPGKKKTAKYAGNWDPEANQPWTYKLQRWILSNTFLTRNMTVLVYGEWPEQSRNVKSFVTASFSENAILRVQEKNFSEPFIFLFVGNLVPGKGLKMSLKVVQRLQEKGVVCRLEIYGDGPERISMETYVERAGIKGIEFQGNRNLRELELAYQKAHFVILPSKSEGWPKAVAEGMFFGCVPVVTPVSCVPWMLGVESGEWIEERGILIESSGQKAEDKEIEEKEIEENVERILEVLGDGERLQRMSNAAKEWSQVYTLERFQEGIREILNVNRIS